MEGKICEKLAEIENKFDVTIIFAAESGSRAWGFPSQDSDYDVRFVYVHQRDWYLSIYEPRDVIEIPVDPVLDVNGWDLKKALALLRKSNAPLLEWISSPIRYQAWSEAFERLAALSQSAFLPETGCHHYLSMAKRKYAQFKGKDRVRAKTCLYAVRPVLCCEWIIRHREQPPMRITELLEAIPDAGAIRGAVTDLIAQKGRQSEAFEVDHIPSLDAYIGEKIFSLEKRIPKNPEKQKIDVFDSVFREILELAKR